MRALAKTYDFVIVGAGIVGLSVARELALRKAGSILVVEKEEGLGHHASGRNSGVVHAGIYYAQDSLKAKFCVDGHRRLLAYVDEHQLPVLKCGKVIVASKERDVDSLSTLMERATRNKVRAEKIDLQQLRELEPVARSHGWAIWSPLTAVIDSKAVLAKMAEEIRALGVEIAFAQKIHSIDPQTATISARGSSWNYGFLFNTAGVYADRIAHQFGVGSKYRILPFKGLYWKATDDFAGRVQRLIYPAPDVTMPFLGLHITRTVDGKVLFGPTAIPAFGRENYSVFGGLDALESPMISWQLLKMMLSNPGNFRRYVREEISRYRSVNFFNESRTLVQELKPSDIGEFYKVGIRAQLMDLEKGRLEMDFVIESGEKSLHVLNAVSPAFTCALAFAPYLADRALGRAPTFDVSREV